MWCSHCEVCCPHQKNMEDQTQQASKETLWLAVGNVTVSSVYAHVGGFRIPPLLAQKGA